MLNQSLPLLQIVGLIVLCAYVAHAADPDSAAKLNFFESSIRPVLVDKCYGCHSGDADEVKAGLRLDSRSAMLRGGDSGAAVVAGKPRESLLIEAIRYESFEMPPRGKLGDREIANFERWIRDGVVWPDTSNNAETMARTADVPKFDWRSRKSAHWSWQPIVQHTPPRIENDSWSRAPIDKFILAQLRDGKLQPAMPADRRTLIRRLYFDLIGLPPTVAQVKAFVEHDSETAYELLVDELLQSPHFGEKWARHWLDLVRYAETRGHEFDYPIEHAHEYRDYLIRAFNADVPYDVLLREHLAGDLVQPPRLHPTEHFNESILGTMFWHFEEGYHGATDVVQYRADQADNRLDVLCKSFLSLSVACARCHDHKFDAISTEDYYGLAGIVRSVRETRLELCSPELLQTYFNDLQGVQSQVQSELKAALRRSLSEVDDRRLTSLAPADDAESQNPSQPNTVYTDFSKADAEKVTHDFDDAVSPIEWICSGSAFGCEPGRMKSLTPATLEVAEVYVDGTGLRPAGVVSTRVLAPTLTGVLRSPVFAMPAGDVFVLVRCKDVSIQLIVEEYRMARHNPVLFEGSLLRGERADTEGEFRWLRLKHGLHTQRETYLEFRDEGDGYFEVAQVRFHHPDNSHALLTSVSDDEQASSPVNDAAQQVLFADRWQSAAVAFVNGKSTGSQQLLLDQALANELFQPKFSKKLIERRNEVIEARPATRMATVSTDGVANDLNVYIRGNHQRQGGEVPRRLPLALSGVNQPPITGTGRSTLADRILADENPFTARVVVNRLWHYIFGVGIVPTVDDFGVMGQPPTHPELLDWLADDLRQHDWSLKSTIRQMVLSSTYRMSSQPRLENARTDSTNKSLHAMRIRRLSAEAIRDQMLAIAGDLSAEVEGASIELNITDFMTGRGRPEKSGPIDGAGRRSVYLKVRRNFMSPMLATFDLPTPTGTRGQRNVSNVPSQALALMNDPFVVLQAKRWAAALEEKEADENDRLQLLVWEAYGRPATADELESMRTFLRQQRNEFGDDRDAEQSAWQDLCHTIFNSKELIFIR